MSPEQVSRLSILMPQALLLPARYPLQYFENNIFVPLPLSVLATVDFHSFDLRRISAAASPLSSMDEAERGEIYAVDIWKTSVSR